MPSLYTAYWWVFQRPQNANEKSRPVIFPSRLHGDSRCPAIYTLLSRRHVSAGENNKEGDAAACDADTSRETRRVVC